jgi:hypothetical protein
MRATCADLWAHQTLFKITVCKRLYCTVITATEVAYSLMFDSRGQWSSGQQAALTVKRTKSSPQTTAVTNSYSKMNPRYFCSNGDHAVPVSLSVSLFPYSYLVSFEKYQEMAGWNQRYTENNNTGIVFVICYFYFGENHSLLQEI